MIIKDDKMPKIDCIRNELVGSFDSAMNKIISSIQGAEAFDNRPKTTAIDITSEEVFMSRWDNKSGRHQT